jgi:hypothetical protein
MRPRLLRYSEKQADGSSSPARRQSFEEDNSLYAIKYLSLSESASAGRWEPVDAMKYLPFSESVIWRAIR